MLVLYPLSGKPRALSTWENMAISGAAPAAAVLFTNPFDTAKVRMQLQGENLRALDTPGSATGKPPANARPYNNSFDCMRKTYQQEGVRGLQKGLTPAIFREASKNVFRIGLYDPLVHAMHDERSAGPVPSWKYMLAGLVTGAMGSISANPFELVKTRLQASVGANSVYAVGAQHNYTGIGNAFASIVRHDGFFGLYRGAGMSVVRAMLGTSANMTSLSLMRDYAVHTLHFADSAAVDTTCAATSGVFTVIAMNPVDITRTRYYNQPTENGKGKLYKSGVDCFLKILRNEGPLAFYKGFTSHVLRISPHYALTFNFQGVLRRQLLKHYDKQDLQSSFRSIDVNQDGRIDQPELVTALASVIPRPEAIRPGQARMTEEQYGTLLSGYATRILGVTHHSGEGYVTFPEYTEAIRELRAIVRERDIHNMFQYYDRDGNGTIDARELRAVLQTVQRVRPGVDIEKQAAQADATVDALMRYADVDHDGVISFREFQAICEKLDSIQGNQILQDWANRAGIKLVL